MAELQLAGIDAQQPLSAARNPMLRQDRTCEILAAELARTLKLELGSQVYMARTRLAELRIGDGRNPVQVIDSVNEQYGAFITDCRRSLRAEPAFTPNDTDYLNSGKAGGPQWYLHAMNFAEAWDKGLGSGGILVAVPDSGCNLQHEELAGSVIDPAVQWPEIEADIANGNATMEDTYGHGTAICGLLCAATDNGRTVAGAAPGIGVVPIKITNDWIDFTIGNCIEAGYLAQSIGADIMVLSFTLYGNDNAVHNMLKDLDAGGMLLLGAAGNDGGTADRFPAAWPEVVSVGATQVGDSRAPFSNFAATVELAAPGDEIKLCGHQFNSGALAYLTEDGTSLSTPLVAAAAALLWDSQPQLEALRVRELLALSGRPSTGFDGNVPVVDAGALLGLSLALKLPELPGLLVTGKLPVEAGVLQEPDSASLLLDSEVLQTLTAAPWQFELDSSTRLLGMSSVVLESSLGGQVSADRCSVLVDNTAGTYPLQDGAESAGGPLAYFDAALAQQHVRLQLENLFLPDWTEAELQQFGKGRWQRIEDGSGSGSHSWYCGELGKQEYDRNEFDCLVTARIDLSEAVSPVLRFSQHYNIQDDNFGYDRASVLFSTDNGASWQTQSGEGHPGWFSGYQPDWDPIEFPLDAFIGEQLHICFSLQSDSLLEGEQAGQPEGWWIDDIYVGEADQSGMADFELLTPLANTLYGAVPGNSSVQVQLANTMNLASISYRLDFKPLGFDAGEDFSVSSTNPSGANLLINSLPRDNQGFWLHATAYDADGRAGRSVLLPLLLFNLAGDVNADGLVDAADQQILQSAIGQQAGDPLWHPFLDSDLDGVVSELDMAAVGYNWSPGS